MNPPETTIGRTIPMIRHLLIDARCVRPHGTGVGNSVLRHLEGIDRLKAAGETARWRVSVLRDARCLNDPLFRERWAPFRNIHFIETPADYTSHPGGDVWQQAWLPRLLERMGADVVYSPAYVGPVYTRRARRVVMLHDDLVWSEPGSYPLKFRLYMQIMARLSAKSAHCVLFPSEDARRLCSERLGLSPARTGVVPNAVDFDIFRPDKSVKREPVVLYVASPEQRKNHEVLVRAMKGMKGVRLRLIGISKDHPRIAELRAIDPARELEIVPHATEEEIAAEMRRAAVYTHPSRGEGFGMPVAEALATGTPVICADIPVLREVAGDAALYRQTDDVKGWREAIEETLKKDHAHADRTILDAYRLENTAKKLLAHCTDERVAWASRP